MSMFQEITKAVGQVANTLGALAGVVSKLAIAADRATDAAYSYADTFVQTTQLRNQGTLLMTQLDLDEDQHEANLRRFKLERAKAKFQKELGK